MDHWYRFYPSLSGLEHKSLHQISGQIKWVHQFIRFQHHVPKVANLVCCSQIFQADQYNVPDVKYVICVSKVVVFYW